MTPTGRSLRPSSDLVEALQAARVDLALRLRDGFVALAEGEAVPDAALDVIGRAAVRVELLEKAVDLATWTEQVIEDATKNARRRFTTVTPHCGKE